MSFNQFNYVGTIIKNSKNKILVETKLKVFAEDISNIAELIIPVFDSVENIVGKGENAGYQHFLLFLQCFQKASSSGP